MKKKNVLLLTLLSSLSIAQVAKPIEIPYVDYPIVKGDHDEVAQQYCLICHSWGYMGKRAAPTGQEPFKKW